MMDFVINETGKVQSLGVTRSNQDARNHAMYDFTMYQSMHTNSFGGSIESVWHEQRVTNYMSQGNYNAWRDALGIIQDGYDVEAKLVLNNDHNYLAVKKEVAKACNDVKALHSTDIDKAVAFSRIQRGIHSRVLQGSVTNGEVVTKPRTTNKVKDSASFAVKHYKATKGAISVLIEMPLAIFITNQEKVDFVQDVEVRFTVSRCGAVRYSVTFIKDNGLALSGSQADGIKKAANKVAKKELRKQGVSRIYDMAA